MVLVSVWLNGTIYRVRAGPEAPRSFRIGTDIFLVLDQGEHNRQSAKPLLSSRVGLHARPAAIFAEAAGDLPVEVTIAAKGEPADEAMDAASILSLMSLGAKHGDVVVLRAEGEGAEEALDSLVKILETDHDAE